MIQRKTKIGEEINTIKIFKNTIPQQSKEVVSPKNKVGKPLVTLAKKKMK